MSQKNILFVSIAFPPKSDPECLQSAKAYKYLAQDDRIRWDVVTSASPTLFMPDDPKLKPLDNFYRQKLSLRIRENKYTNFLLRKLKPGALDQPDSKAQFHRQWQRVIKELKNPPQAIYSRSFPLSSSIMAYKLAEHYQVPWIMHLSDPWVENPLHSYPGKALTYHKTWEAKCLGRAQKVTFTSTNALKLYQRKYPKWAGKFLLYPNVYDPEDVQPNPLVWGSKLKIVYTGGMAMDRSASHLLPVLQKWEAQIPSIRDTVEVVFAGPLDRQNQQVFDQNSLPWVKHVGMLSYPDALALQRTAHMLLVIDNPLPAEKAVFFPSKLLDYFTAQRSIMAITSPGSPTENSIKGAPHRVFNHGNEEEMLTFFEKQRQAFLAKDETKFLASSLPEKYSAKKNAQTLAQWLLDL